MIIHLIRHGLTIANEKRLYCGAADVSLSDNGIAGLRALKTGMDYPSAEIYITSGMKRTAETLKIQYDKTPDVILPEFREFEFGAFDMKSYDELKGRADYQAWLNAYDTAHCPGGESQPSFRLRIERGLAKLSGLNAASAVIICHGGTIAVIMDILFPGERNFYEWQPDCGHGYSIRAFEGDNEITGTL